MFSYILSHIKLKCSTLLAFINVISSLGAKICKYVLFFISFIFMPYINFMHSKNHIFTF